MMYSFPAYIFQYNNFFYTQKHFGLEVNLDYQATINHIYLFLHSPEPYKWQWAHF